MTSLGRHVVPSLLARDLDATSRFYTDILRFKRTGVFPDDGEPVWIEVTRDDVVLQFYRDPPPGTPETPLLSGVLYLYPDDVNALADELRDKVEFEWGPEVMEYRMREFAIRDCNGYLLAFTEAA